MDGFLNKAKSAISSASSGGNGQNQQQGQNQQTGTGTGNAQAGGSEDYGDKGLDFIEKKTGHTFSREQNEKITDGARNFYEKETGNKVDAKYSN